MGLPKNTLDFVLGCIGKFPGKRMLELGNQRIRDDVDTPFKTGKEYFENLGYKHTSIDLSGEDGSLKFDLAKPIESPGRFDIVTNCGMSSWVDNEEECFRNIHSLCKVRGAMIHVLPDIGTDWHGIKHGKQFMYDLAIVNNYRLVNSTIIEGKHGRLIATLLVKRANAEFVWPLSQ